MDNTRIMTSPEYLENLLTLLADNDEVTLGNGIVWKKTGDCYDEENSFALRAVVPMSLFNGDLTLRADVYYLMTEALSTMLSETTNNDACRWLVTETAAHFEFHGMEEFADLPFASVVVFNGRIEDSLS